ncbi:WLM protein [Rhizoctonia solani]|uniref:WLM protein n=1 Tax=Rhizoctonia solani TaxID=456999 RepID=A0A8H7IHW6_9AGAM|nr:WLM protein [Rhizoctonia solani]
MSLIRAFTHLANQPRAPEALYTLKRIADLAYPIMKQHGWVIPVLSEFFPDDERLLGEFISSTSPRALTQIGLSALSTPVLQRPHCLPFSNATDINSGDKILIRLRPARSPGTFYPIEQLVRVMLHELTHNVHGPHDERFYSLLNKLEDEYDTLVTSGWQGSGFYAPGERLGSKDQGGWGSRSWGSFDIGSRRKALEAAEARLKIERSRSGGRLGGSESSARAGRTIQELAANAADRRRRDKQTCAASHPSADREAARAAVDSIASVVEDADLAEALQLSSVLAEPVDHPNSTRATVVELPTSLARVIQIQKASRSLRALTLPQMDGNAYRALISIHSEPHEIVANYARHPYRILLFNLKRSRGHVWYVR